MVSSLHQKPIGAPSVIAASVVGSATSIVPPALASAQ
jgi:hypothetical protein